MRKECDKIFQRYNLLGSNKKRIKQKDPAARDVHVRTYHILRRFLQIKQKELFETFSCKKLRKNFPKKNSSWEHKIDFCHRALLYNILIVSFHLIMASENVETSCIFNRFQTFLKNVRAHCYCASLVRTLFIRHARATSFSSVRTKSKTQLNIELMTLALTWCANIFVGCSVTPTFFFGRSLPFLILSIILKNKKNLYVGSFNYSSYTIQKGSNWYMDRGLRDLEAAFFKANIILPDLMTNVAKIYQTGLYMPC